MNAKQAPRCSRSKLGARAPELLLPASGQQKHTGGLVPTLSGRHLSNPTDPCLELLYFSFQITNATTAQGWTTGARWAWRGRGGSASPGTRSTPTHTPSPPSGTLSSTGGTPTAATPGTRRTPRGASPWTRTSSPSFATCRPVVIAAFFYVSLWEKKGIWLAPSVQPSCKPGARRSCMHSVFFESLKREL